MITKTQLKKVNTIDELNELGIGNVVVDISRRGGGIGFRSSDVADHFKVDGFYLPRKYGAGCNYLGGGIRGSIFPSGYDSVHITGRKAELLDALAAACVRAYKLDALAAACVRAYKSAEDEMYMNDEQDDDGDINWDAKATNAVRVSGIRSAY